MSNIAKVQELKNKIDDINKDIKIINDQIELINNPTEKGKLSKTKLEKQIRINNLVNKIDFIIFN